MPRRPPVRPRIGGTAAILLFLIVLFANIAETVLGFGATVITVALGAHLYPLATLLPVIVPVNLVLSGYIAFRHRRYIAFRTLTSRIIPWSSLGLVAGLAVFEIGRSEALRAGYGLFVALFAVGSLIALARRPSVEVLAWGRRGVVGSAGRTRRRRLPPAQAAFWLLGAGFFQGLYASGGPMLVYYANRDLSGKGSFRSTLAAVWSILTAAMVVIYLFEGHLTAATLRQSAGLLPAVVLALAAGEYLHTRVEERPFRAIVLFLLLVAGLSFLAPGP